MIRRGMGVASALLAIGLTAGWMESAVHSSPVDAVRTSSRFVMIQGRVDQVSKGWATVTTVAWQPYCPPRRMCPMIVMAGHVYQVRLAGATADNASGLPWSGSMQAGESVVIAGNLLSHRNGSPRTFTSAGVPVVPMQVSFLGTFSALKNLDISRHRGFSLIVRFVLSPTPRAREVV